MERPHEHMTSWTSPGWPHYRIHMKEQVNFSVLSVILKEYIILATKGKVPGDSDNFLIFCAALGAYWNIGNTFRSTSQETETCNEA